MTAQNLNRMLLASSISVWLIVLLLGFTEFTEAVIAVIGVIVGLITFLFPSITKFQEQKWFINPLSTMVLTIICVIGLVKSFNVLFLSNIRGEVALPLATSTIEFNPTNSPPSVTPQPAEISSATSTIEFNPTNSPPSVTPQPTETPSVTSTIEFSPVNPIVTGGKESSLIFKKDKGVIENNLDVVDGEDATGISVKNFTASARFYNPSDSWSYGFYLRTNGQGEYRLTITSGGGTRLVFRPKDGEDKEQYIKIEGLKASTGLFNDISVKMKDQIAQVYVNNQLSATLTLDEAASSGRVILFMGYYSGDTPVETFRYEKFTVHLEE